MPNDVFHEIDDDLLDEDGIERGQRNLSRNLRSDAPSDELSLEAGQSGSDHFVDGLGLLSMGASGFHACELEKTIHESTEAQRLAGHKARELVAFARLELVLAQRNARADEGGEGRS